jgi:formylglycine-generating enzyme required for sulfatase activity
VNEGAAIAADAAHRPDHQPKAKIFISYSRKDMAFADRLEGALEARGFEPLIDRTEIYAFEDWWKRIEALIGKADTIVFVLSPDAVTSEVALKEVAHATSLNKRFAPIVCRLVDGRDLPETLRRLNFIFFDDPAQFEASADKLADALATDIGWIRRHTEFGEAARRWIEGGRASGLLLRPPVLDQAEAWMAFRPASAPPPTGETEAFIAASRTAEVTARRRNRILNGALYTMLVGIILGLVGWINQDYLKAQWRWYTVERPFAAAHIWPYVLNAAVERALKAKESFQECAAVPGTDYCPEMVVVPAGEFLMGSPLGDDTARLNELPKHRVSITKSFAVSKFELTFDQWETCVAYGGCRPGISAAQGYRGRHPVIDVTWDDARQYVRWLSQMTGKTYRLLSEAEYEYAARAGSTTEYPWGEEVGKNNADCSGCGSQWDGKGTAPVGSFSPNAFGLHDMVGNVNQWVEDCAHDNYLGAPEDGSAWLAAGDCERRMVRGGSWFQSPESVRSAGRNSGATDFASPNLGFRVARTLLTR